MANVNRAFGLIPVMYQGGSPYTGKVNMYLVPVGDGTAMYVGDPVKSGGTAGAAGVTVNGIDCEGLATVTTAAAGNTLRGVVVGFLPNQDSLTTKHRAASTARIALVADDPNLIFEVQEDSVGAATAAIDVGENADIIYAAGSATTGISGVMLDSSDHQTTTAQLRILGFVKRPDNAIGTNAKLLVMINEHELKTTTGV
jgi:hypothetical protein